MSKDPLENKRCTPSTIMARRLYPPCQANNGTNEASSQQGSGTTTQDVGANRDKANAGAEDKLAPLLDMLERDPNLAYNKYIDKRHPELKNVTPELRPFLREVIMRQELKGWTPKIQQTKRTDEEEQRHIDDGTSGLSNPKSTKHFDLGNGADAADVTDERYGWGKEEDEEGAEAEFKDQRAKAYFKDQQQSFEDTKKRWGSRADRYNWGGYWKRPYDPAHIENSKRVLPEEGNDDDNEE